MGILDPAYKREWVEALRSGKYEQGSAALCKNGYYCCLGVLAELDGQLKRVPGERGSKGISREYEGEDGTYIDYEMGEYYGLRGELHTYISDLDIDDDHDRYRTVGVELMEMNDGGETFDTIANWIDKYL